MIKPHFRFSFIFIACQGCCGIVVSQSFDFGINVIYNSSSHTNYDPTIPEDGTFQWNYLGTWGGGVYASKRWSSNFGGNLSLNYQQKGYKELAQVGYIPGGPIYDENLRNTFDYLSLGLTLKYNVSKSKSLQPFLNIGLEYNYLIDYKIESDFFPINNFYPVNEYQDRWKKNTLNIVPSISILIDQATSLEFGLNGSLTPVLETENLIVRDWIWTFRVSQSLPALFKKSVANSK